MTKYKSLGAITLFTILTSTFTCFSQDNMVDQIIAVVGNSIILESEIDGQSHQLSQQGYTSSNDLKCEILEESLFQKLLLDQAKKDSLEISPGQVEDELERRFRYFVEQIGSEEKLEDYFGKSIIEMKEDLRGDIKEQILSQQMRDKLTSDIKITPSEVRSYYNGLNKDSLPFIDVEIEIQQIIKNPKVTEKEKLEVKTRLLEFKERVKNGDKFSTLAVLYSEDPGSSTQGGKLGFVGRGDLVSEFAAVAFNLQIGEVSKIVETEFGYHIIQVTEKRGELINASHILLKPKTNYIEIANAKNYLDSIATLINDDSLTFEQAALKFSDDDDSKFNGGLVINPYTGTSKFEPNSLDPVTNYAISNIKVGEFTKPFEAADMRGMKEYKIVKVKSKSKPHQANIIDDYQQIKDAALNDKKQEELEDWIQRKQKNTFIKIDKSYKACVFNYTGWVK